MCVYLHTLYFILFLHQTATGDKFFVLFFFFISFFSYIKPQLIMLFIRTIACCISFFSYIKPQLSISLHSLAGGCISFFSYIKPQPNERQRDIRYVVFHSFPTSNRNIIEFVDVVL